jgi:hypothetical protein
VDPDLELLQQSRAPRTGLVRELTAFLWANKAWWLVPIVLVLVLFGALVVLGGSGVAPFIYTLF